MLLRAIAAGFAEAGRWPVWQWVARRIRDQQDDYEPDELIGSLPTWQHSYRPAVAVNVSGLIPFEPGHEVVLTAVGMFHAGEPATNDLLVAMVQAVEIASELQAGARPPTPSEAVAVTVGGKDLVTKITEMTGISVDSSILLAALRREPHVWGGLVETSAPDGDWHWDLNVVRLRKFRGIKTAADYLARLDPLVVYPESPRVEHGLAPSALPEALDHLNLAWRLATGRWLFRVRRFTATSALCEPVAGAADFHAACSAIADVLASIDLPGEGPSLNRLASDLKNRLPHPDRAREGIQTLRHVVAIRAAQQHSGSDSAQRADRARVALGLGRFASNWSAAWDHLRAVTVGALRTIREEIETLIPD